MPAIASVRMFGFCVSAQALTGWTAGVYASAKLRRNNLMPTAVCCLLFAVCCLLSAFPSCSARAGLDWMDRRSLCQRKTQAQQLNAYGRLLFTVYCLLFAVCCLLFRHVEPTHANYHLGRSPHLGQGCRRFVRNGVFAKDSCGRTATAADRRADELS